MAEEGQGTPTGGDQGTTGSPGEGTGEAPPSPRSGIKPSDIPPRDSTMKWEKPKVIGEPLFDITTKIIPDGDKKD